MKRVSMTVLMGLGLTVRAGQAHADTELEQRAEAHKTLGSAAFRSGDFDECAKQYLASHKLVPDPNKLFNVGLCYEKGENYAESLGAFREYLAAAPDGNRAREANTRIELLELKLQAAGARNPVEPVDRGPGTADPGTADQVAASTSGPTLAAPMPSAATSATALGSTASTPAISSSERKPPIPDYERARDMGLRLGAAVGYADDQYGNGLMFSLFGGYDLSFNGGPHPMGNRIGLRVDFATIDEDDGDNSLTHVGAEYRASLQSGRVRGYVGVGAGYSRYVDGLEDGSGDSVGSGFGFQANAGADIFVLGRHTIGAYGQLQLARDDDGFGRTLYAFGLAVTRY